VDVDVDVDDMTEVSSRDDMMILCLRSWIHEKASIPSYLSNRPFL
jgi:hypothetical protein